MMFCLKQYCRGGACIGSGAAGAGFAVGRGDFGAQFGASSGSIDDIRTNQIGFVSICFVMDCRCCNLQLFVLRLPLHTATAIVDALANAIDFIFGNDELRIKARRTRQHRSAKTQSSSKIVNVIIDVTD